MILDGEMPLEEIIERQHSHRLPKNVFLRSVVHHEDYKKYKGLLLNEQYRNFIEQNCIDNNIKFLIIDNKKSFHPGLDENNNGGA